MTSGRRTGTPDFNQNPASNPTSPIFNQGEVSNRLLMGGGGNSQSGYWLWASGFENGLGEFITPPSSPPAIENTFVYQGFNSCKLLTSNVINNESAVNKTFYAQGSRYGVEVLVSQSLTTGADREFRIRISGRYQNVGKRASGVLVWKITSVDNSNLYYENNGVQTLISNLNDYTQDSGDLFHYMKLCFDPITNLYIRAYFDDLIFELPNVQGYINSGVTRETFVTIANRTKSANASTSYIDNVIITAGEP